MVKHGETYGCDDVSLLYSSWSVSYALVVDEDGTYRETETNGRAKPCPFDGFAAFSRGRSRCWGRRHYDYYYAAWRETAVLGMMRLLSELMESHATGQYAVALMLIRCA